MNDSSISSLVTLALIFIFGAIFHIKRRKSRFDRPMLMILYLLAITAFSSIFLPHPYNYFAAAAVIIVGIILLELPARISLTALWHRIRGRYSSALKWFRWAYILQPTAVNRLTLNLLQLLVRHQRGELSTEQAKGYLSEVQPDIENLKNSSLYRFLWETLYALYSTTGRWKELAEKFDPVFMPLYASPPSGAGSIMLSALCRSGDIETAASILREMELSFQQKSIVHEEVDAHHNRARIIFLLSTGNIEKISTPLSRESALYDLVSAEEIEYYSSLKLPSPLPPEEESELIRRLHVESRLSRNYTLFTHLTPLSATIALTIIVFFGAFQLLEGNDSLVSFVHWGAAHLSLVEAGQWWRLFSASILHAGWLHFMFNLYFLLIFSPLVERLLGRTALLLLFVGGSAVGFISAMALKPHALIVGASAGIFAIFGASAGAVFLYREQLPARWYRRQTHVALILIALNFYLGLTVPIISLESHIGGFLWGAAISIVSYLLFPSLFEPPRGVLKILSRFVFFSLAALALLSLTFQVRWITQPKEKIVSLFSPSSLSPEMEQFLTALFSELISEGEREAEAVLNFLSQSDKEKFADLLLFSLSSPSQKIRDRGLEIMADKLKKNSLSLQQKLLKLLSSSSPAVRAISAYLFRFVSRPDPYVMEKLFGALTTSNKGDLHLLSTIYILSERLPADQRGYWKKRISHYLLKNKLLFRPSSRPSSR